MGHALHAVIGQLPALTDLQTRFDGVTLVALDQGFALAPLPERLFDAISSAHGAPEAIRHREGFIHMTEALDTLLSDLSRLAPVAYIETDYFGGAGSQAAAAYIDGVRTTTGGHTDESGVVADSGAINEALAAIGVRRRWRMDEFDTMGLARYRDTDDCAGEGD